MRQLKLSRALAARGVSGNNDVINNWSNAPQEWPMPTTGTYEGSDVKVPGEGELSRSRPKSLRVWSAAPERERISCEAARTSVGENLSAELSATEARERLSNSE